MTALSLSARVLAAAVTTAVLTWWAGWWAVVPIALVAGALPPRSRLAPGAMALAGTLGWAALLGFQLLHPASGTLLERVAGVFQLPGAALVIVTLLYAALLSWSAAVIGNAIGRRAPAPVTPASAEASPRYEPADRAVPAAVDSTAS